MRNTTTNGTNLDSKLEMLINQVGRLSEGLTNKCQERSIDRLVTITDRLVAATEKQSAIIEQLSGGQ